MFDTKHLCQICKHYDIGCDQCSKAPERAIPKSECADFDFYPQEALCKYCSHNDYGRCTVLGPGHIWEKMICADFENKANMNKKMEYKKKEWLCARCANQCKAHGGMDYCEKFIDEEEAERIENAKKIAAIRKRCEEFMHDIVRDFGKLLIIKDTAEISETERKKIDWNKEKQIPYTDKSPFIDFSLKFTVYKKD